MKSARLALFAAVAFALLGAAGAFAEKAEPSQPEFRWRFATLAPKDYGWARHINALVLPAIEKAAEGKLSIKVYWGGVLGDDQDYITKMEEGSLEGAGLSGRGVTLAMPETSVLEIPFLFNGYEEVDCVKAALHGEFGRIAEKHGFFLVGWVDQDFDQIYSVDKPLACPADFLGVSFQAWYGPLEDAFLQELSAKLVPVAVPRFSEAMRAGKVKASISPAAWMVGSQMYSVVKYINPIRVRYSPAMILLRLDRWKALPKVFQDRFEAIRPDVEARFCKQVREDNAKALEAMFAYGLTEVSTSPGCRDKFDAIAERIADRFAGVLYEKSLLTQVREELRQCRAKVRKP
ncbi:MAG: TRAP transporter substrate-binding protein DctP [Thermodesulfobacteriota bacterium]